jgi:glucose-6-phosphate 1-dehydrogenase
MEQPKDLSPESVRDEKIKVLQAIRPIPVNDLEHHAFRAQYGKGSIKDEEVPGYLEELGTDSVVETYAALKLFVDNPRWKGVPFYVRTAKRLHEGSTAVSIRFKKAPLQLSGGQDQNWLMLGIQPRESIKLEIQSKIPGLDVATRTISMDAPQRQDGDETIDAYESLLLNLIEGDQSLYLHINEVEASWRLLDPVIEAWAMDKSPVHTYPAGSRDPNESRVIFENEDQFWRYSIEIGGDQ